MSNAIKWKELGAELETAPAHFLKSVELERERRKEARKEAQIQKRREEMLEEVLKSRPDLAALVDNETLPINDAWYLYSQEKKGREIYRNKVRLKFQEIAQLSHFLEAKNVPKLACDIVRDMEVGSDEYLSVFLNIGFCIENLQILEKSLLEMNRQMLAEQMEGDI